MTRAILTLNAGSSSIKCALYELDSNGTLQLAARARVQGIGTDPAFRACAADGREIGRHRWSGPAPDFDHLLEHVVHWAEHHLGQDTLAAVGHRVVHGGAAHVQPERVTPALLASVEALTPLAPLHLPHNLAPIRAIAASRPRLPQVACFDTAFHHTLPPVAQRFALPRAYAEAGIRRYGFHGLSYEYIAGRLPEDAPALAAGRTIVAHLGNGASLCALEAGRSIETSMGFTALDGLVMGTRCGRLDPGVVLHLIRQRGLSPEQVEDLLYRHAGLLGVSGISSDMQQLLDSADPRAQEAIELFVYRVAGEIGTLVAALGGLDGLVFTAGIGEHAAPVRARICGRLAWLGLALDTQANVAHAGRISAPASRVDVRVMATDEEAVIARHTRRLLSSAGGPAPGMHAGKA